jgi:hypothetical protein
LLNLPVIIGKWEAGGVEVGTTGALLRALFLAERGTLPLRGEYAENEGRQEES